MVLNGTDSRQLLTRDPNRRLGSGKGDAEEIKAHPFFKDVDWDAVLNKQYPPPYFPQIVSIKFFVIYIVSLKALIEWKCGYK